MGLISDIKEHLTVMRLKRSMNHIFLNLQTFIAGQEVDPIEYGNLRQGDKWGIRMGHHVVWVIEIDFLRIATMEYKIIYNITRGIFSGFSDFGQKLKLRKLTQFTSKNTNELIEKVTQLVKNIPYFRDKVLREYVFGHLKDKLNFKLGGFFQRNKDKQGDEEAQLIGLVEELRREKQISDLECKRTIEYTKKLKNR